MNISTTSRHYDLAPALKDYAEGKVQNLKRYFDQIVNANLIFSLEKYRHRVEITLHVNGKDFVSVEESDDMYAAVDKSVDKLETQLRRHKDKIKRRKNQTRATRLGDIPGNGDGKDEIDDAGLLDEDETLGDEIQ
jgi:putative sigma-54 modulation protein